MGDFLNTGSESLIKSGLKIPRSYIPTEEDDSVKEYLRMRDDYKDALKKIKQQINEFCLRHGHHYEGTKWTIKHVTCLRKLELSPLYSCLLYTSDAADEL